MPKLDLKLLTKQVKDSYKKKKRDSKKIGLGTEISKPSDYIPAPPPIARILNLPGYPIRRVSMIAGKPDSGKSSLGMLALKEAQNKDYYAILIDTEKKFDTERFEKMGGKPEDLLKVSATTIEDCFVGIDEYLEKILEHDKKANVFIVWDSIGGTPSKAESEIQADQSLQLATAAKVIKRGLRILVQKFDTYNIGLLLVNQSYMNIGSVGRSNAGGEGVDYFSSVIIQLSRKGHVIIMEDKEKYKAGVDVVATVTKNHLSQGEKTLYKSDFRVRAYDIIEIKDNKKED